MATDIQDTDLLSRIAGGDLVAIEAMYHNACLRIYKNRHRALIREQNGLESDDSHQMKESQVFAELVSYIEASVEDGKYIFPLADLYKLYSDKLFIFGYDRITNKSRLKERIQDQFIGQCQEQTDGRNTLLVFNDGMRSMMRKAMQNRDLEDEALTLAKIAKRIRGDMFSEDLFQFSGTFPDDCEQNSVPHSLKSLVSTLLYGPNIQDDDMTNTRACLTISQLILFNSKEKSANLQKPRHSKKREPPLPLYIGLDVHTRTRNKNILTHLYELGLSVSYERVLDVGDALTSAVCQRYTSQNMVCPPQVRKDIFTVGALDNIDHNPSSSTAEGSFHGTSISILQFPTTDNPGIVMEPVTLNPDSSTDTPSLPDKYCIVPAVSCSIDALSVPEVIVTNASGVVERSQEEEKKWTLQSISLLQKDKLEKTDCISWGAYHASQQPEASTEAGVSCLLPLFDEKAATISMVKHGMGIIKEITAFCNPGQVPVMAVDQPLFALAKYVQWGWPNTFGEDMFTVMLGGLHTEMALWRMLGNLLEDSGWTVALFEAGVASSGTADSFLTVSHVTKTRHAHQVTALTLAKLQRDACRTLNGECEEEAFQQWKKQMMQGRPMFKFWDLILQLETLVLIFVRSHRERNFHMYVEVMDLLAPWFFILDHTNYARWLSVHIRDMKTLLALYSVDFMRNWCFPKTKRTFSAMPLDQAHEQNNKTVKDSGGAVGLTENPKALKRWMIAGPEQSRLLQEFDKQTDKTQCDSKSHEQSESRQNKFKTQACQLYYTIASMGNPFLEESTDLMTLDDHDCVDESVSKALNSLESVGREQYDLFVQDTFMKRTQSIHAPIKKNYVPLFKRRQPKAKSKIRSQVDDIKSDYSLFSQMFIACQVRQADLSEFFCHENHHWPVSLSQHGKLRLPSCKSELLDCFKKHVLGGEQPHVDAKIFDGAAVVHSLPTGEAKTFGEYCDMVFLPWTERQLGNCNRIDIVWDTYIDGSLKEATREKRGKGKRRKVSRQTKLPANFPLFLRDSKNKEELFELLTGGVAGFTYETGKNVFITSGRNVSSNSSEVMNPSDHEEADTRICLHVEDVLKKGGSSVLVNTVDTDIIIVLVGNFSKLEVHNSSLQIYVALGKALADDLCPKVSGLQAPPPAANHHMFSCPISPNPA
ncbi:uncharacterized protein LOC124254923 [Haliotis rubra]|uniref:uncharacterized protein LOC124254923 n=1 Tax=Haliotis rubra TaxID=36100 RepID=UPI001EE58AB3|nr:uncharacterized protein LOC124254923 [Haliotis rubra]